MRQLSFLIILCVILWSGCDNSTSPGNEWRSIPLPPETTIWVNINTVEPEVWPRNSRLALLSLRRVLPEIATVFVSQWEEGIYAALSGQEGKEILTSAKQEEKYLEYLIYRLPDETRSFYAAIVSDYLMITDNLAALERLIDLEISKELKYFQVSVDAESITYYHRPEKAINWEEDFGGLMPNGYLIQLDKSTNKGVIKLENDLKKGNGQLTDLLARLPGESTDFSVVSRAIAGDFGSFTACLRSPQGTALMARYLGTKKLSNASFSYLNIEMWQSPIDYLGLDVDSRFIYWYCLIDGYLWEARRKDVIQRIIRRSVAGGESLLEKEEIISVFTEMPNPDYFGAYRTNLRGVILEQQVLIAAKGKSGQVVLHPAKMDDSIEWEHDFGSEITYFQTDAITGNWLVQCVDGYVYRGKENRVEELLNADPLIGQPYFGLDGSLIFQTHYEVYRQSANRLDTVNVESAAPMLHLFEPMEEDSRHYLPRADGYLIGLNGDLDSLESWKNVPSTSRLFDQPVLLQGEAGEVLLANSAEKGILGFGKDGTLKFVLAPDTVGSPIGDRFYVSSADPYATPLYRPDELIDHTLLRLGSDSLLQVNADGTFTRHCPRPKKEVEDVLVQYNPSGKRMEYFLLYGNEIHAFTSEKGIFRPLWQYKLTSSEGQFIRFEGSRDWGVYFANSGQLIGFSEGDTTRSWLVSSSYLPGRDATNGGLLVPQGAMLLSKQWPLTVQSGLPAANDHDQRPGE